MLVEIILNRKDAKYQISIAYFFAPPDGYRERLRG
jgi:hypothetical protein